MPNRDGTGPDGKGEMTGRGRGYQIEGQENNAADNNANRGLRRGPGRGGRGRGTGQGNGRRQRLGFGQKRRAESTLTENHCVCPSCGEKVEHKTGHPCYEQKCSKCESMMVRE